MKNSIIALFITLLILTTISTVVYAIITAPNFVLYIVCCFIIFLIISWLHKLTVSVLDEIDKEKT